MDDYFIAYGTNIAQKELLEHCEGAEFIGYGMLKDYVMEFRGYNEHAVAFISKQRGEILPVAIWHLPPESRYTIDNFEKFPYVYKREKAKALIDGQTIKGTVYVLKQNLPYGEPSKDYLDSLKQAYKEADFDEHYIEKALERLKNKENV